MKKRNKRLTRIMGIMFLLWTLVVANVLFVMVTQTHLWSGKTVLDPRIPQDRVPQVIRAKRGTIYDRNNHAIAQDMKAYTIIAYTKYYYSDEDVELDAENANYIQNPKEVAKKLATVLNVNEESVVHILENAIELKRKQTELGNGTKQITEEKKKAIEEMEIPGIDFIEDSSRYYTISPFASNLIGFANYNIDKKIFTGELGLEKEMEDTLSGTNGLVKYQQSRTGKLIAGTLEVEEQAYDGYDVHLTLDWNLQSVVEKALQTTMEINDAQKAWCIVMECDTGKVLAWSTYPTFDQNNRTEIPSFINTISQESFELGSVMKPFTYAIAMDTGVYPMNKKFRSHQFWYKIQNNKITRVEEGTDTIYSPIGDALDEDFGEITFDEGFALSSNVGICELLANYINYKDYYSYMENFGFFQPVSISYVPSATGISVLTESFNPDIATDYLSTGFGQSTSITPLQLMQAYSAIFNNGIMVKPYVVESIKDSKTKVETEVYAPEVVGTPISKETAKQVRDLMKKVVEEGGTGSRLAIEGIDMIAKTGTAQIYDSELQAYREDIYTNSVIAAAPSDNPKIMVYYGMQSANYYYDPSPFQEIMISALHCNTVDAAIKTEEKNTAVDVKQEINVVNAINHSVDFVQSKVSSYPHVVFIGDGDMVIDQYPEKGTKISPTQTLFLLTNGSHYTMPDMTNWTLKDISVFWKMTGIQTDTNGSGMVYNQNIEAGSLLSKEDHIILYLQ